MSWKESKVLLLPHDEGLQTVESQKPDIQDLYLLGQAAAAVSALKSPLPQDSTLLNRRPRIDSSPPRYVTDILSQSPTTFLPQHPVKLEPGSSYSALLDSTVMPPPPPPPPRHATSPPTSVSSTSEEHQNRQDSVQIGKTTNVPANKTSSISLKMSNLSFFSINHCCLSDAKLEDERVCLILLFLIRCQFY